MAAQKRIETFKERVGSPLGTSETSHLTLTQRDDAASLIDSVLVQDEQYQLWLASWQGASQSVLDGVQTREAMDSYIHRLRRSRGPAQWCSKLFRGYLRSDVGISQHS